MFRLRPDRPIRSCRTRRWSESWFLPLFLAGLASGLGGCQQDTLTTDEAGMFQPAVASAVGATTQLAVLAAAFAGALWSAPPALLRAWLGVDEVVSTLMLNYVAILLTSYLVNEFFLAPGIANSMSPLVADQARLPALIPRTQVTAAFLIALAATAVVAVVFRATAPGYDLHIVGL